MNSLRLRTSIFLEPICRVRHLSHIPKPPSVTKRDLDQSDFPQARSWLSQFRSLKLERRDVDLSFSRSSGPGGQNVNKLNTKASARVSIQLQWIPEWAKPGLRASPHYVSSSDSLLVTSSVSRSQATNVDDCLQKLHYLILRHAEALIGRKTVPETKDRVERHKRVADSRRRSDKNMQSQLKQSRSKKNWDH